MTAILTVVEAQDITSIKSPDNGFLLCGSETCREISQSGWQLPHRYSEVIFLNKCVTVDSTSLSTEVLSLNSNCKYNNENSTVGYR